MGKGENPFVARIRDPQFQWQAAFVLFFLLSLGMGMGDGWVYTLGWGIMAIFTLFFIFRGFPYMFTNAIFLLLAYAAVFGSVVAFFWVPTHRGQSVGGPWHIPGGHGPCLPSDTGREGMEGA